MRNESLWLEIEDLKPFAGNDDPDIWMRLGRLQEHGLSARALFALKSLLEAVYDKGVRDARDEHAGAVTPRAKGPSTPIPERF